MSTLVRCVSVDVYMMGLSLVVTEYLDFVLILDLWLIDYLLAYGLMFTAFNLGFEDANIPYGPVEGTDIFVICNNPDLFHFVSMFRVYVNCSLTWSNTLSEFVPAYLLRG
jgi:hypothetical protein